MIDARPSGRARSFALAVLFVSACHRTDASITRDVVDAPRAAPTSSTSPVPLDDAFTSTPLPSGCAFDRAFTPDAWLTLAFVRAHAIERDEGQCGVTEDGAQWIALGPFGERVGELERVTTPSEGNTFRLVSGTKGTNVYVRGGVPRFVSYAWVPFLSEDASLRALVSSAKTRRVVYFRSSTDLHFAAVEEEKGLSLFEEKAGAYWDRVHHAEEPSVAWPTYDLRAILDVNDDGMPEVIEHFDEYADGRGFDIVAQRASSGDWEEVADNEDTGP